MSTCFSGLLWARDAVVEVTRKRAKGSWGLPSIFSVANDPTLPFVLS